MCITNVNSKDKLIGDKMKFSNNENMIFSQYIKILVQKKYLDFYYIERLI